MRRSRVAALVMWATFFTGLIAALLARSDLPEKVATHYDLAGNPDDWMSRDGFLLLWVGLMVGVALLFTILSWLLPRIPNGLINMPHKDYWLAPERREETLADVMATMHWIGAATMLFLVVLFRVTWVANLTESGTLGSGFWVAMVAFLVVVLWLSFGMMWRYRKPGTNVQAP